MVWLIKSLSGQSWRGPSSRCCSPRPQTLLFTAVGRRKYDAQLSKRNRITSLTWRIQICQGSQVKLKKMYISQWSSSNMIISTSLSHIILCMHGLKQCLQTQGQDLSSGHRINVRQRFSNTVGEGQLPNVHLIRDPVKVHYIIFQYKNSTSAAFLLMWDVIHLLCYQILQLEHKKVQCPWWRHEWKCSLMRSSLCSMLLPLFSGDSLVQNWHIWHHSGVLHYHPFKWTHTLQYTHP